MNTRMADSIRYLGGRITRTCVRSDDLPARHEPSREGRRGDLRIRVMTLPLLGVIARHSCFPPRCTTPYATPHLHHPRRVSPPTNSPSLPPNPAAFPFHRHSTMTPSDDRVGPAQAPAADGTNLATLRRFEDRWYWTNEGGAEVDSLGVPECRRRRIRLREGCIAP